MSIKTALFALIIGSSSVALAHPDEVRDHREITNPQFSANPQLKPGYSWRRPIMLATGVSIAPGFRDHRTSRPLFIDVDQRMPLSKLQFAQNTGRTYIDSVVVMLANGSSRTYSVHQTLSRQSPSISVDLAPGSVTGIYVYGSAMRGRGSFDVTGQAGMLWRPRYLNQ